MSQRPRVVVTGIGAVTPIGTGVDDFWEGMTSGRNGVRQITQFPTEDLSVKVAGEVDGFDPSAYLETKEARRTDRYVQFALASASLAWTDAATPEIVSERGGCIFGTGIGGIQTLLTQHSVRREPPFLAEYWGKRAFMDAPDSKVWGGQCVFDVYSKYEGKALDGSKYKDW